MTQLEYHEWTKRLGQKHWSRPGESETICGKPMLGNNYARILTEKDKELCEDCKAAHNKKEMLGENDETGEGA